MQMTLARQVDLEEPAGSGDGTREEDQHQTPVGASPDHLHQPHHQHGQQHGQQQVYSTLTPRYSMRSDLYNSKEELGETVYATGYFHL